MQHLRGQVQIRGGPIGIGAAASAPVYGGGVGYGRGNTLPSLSRAVARWEAGLRSHPDREFAAWLVRGLKSGFRIGFDYEAYTCRAARKNMRSAKEQADVVNNYLRDERAQHRVIDSLFSGRTAHFSPFGEIPKPRQPSKWRLILDLSSPHGHSVNGDIDPHLCSPSYSRVDDAATRILALGRGTLLTKMDIQSAYRLIPVHLDDCHLLGMR
ncbi:uncharacterized protein LOC134189239 [Corticium candelabrum]|uniref:uncharacterized protein LOC134189239 n=1 Tax=Corticium candelabrum TaxID=121492 RepID=UPI002E2774DE|nr:uncharacterized protein LOC134189239 [Corticium candelabrum]